MNSYVSFLIRLAALQARGGARMKLHSFRQDLQDYQDFLGLVELYPVHPVDPVRKWNVLSKMASLQRQEGSHSQYFLSILS